MFKFKYRRRLFWRSYKISGFKFNEPLDRMSLYFQDGSIVELSKWSACDCALGADYFMILHKKMEMEAGQKIPVSNAK